MMIRAVVVSVFLALGLASCASTPQIYYPQLSALDKGMSQSEVGAALKQSPLGTYPASEGARSFEFQKYLMNNGMQADAYLLAYEGQKLVFWGYVAEFRRQSDAVLISALNQALSEMRATR